MRGEIIGSGAHSHDHTGDRTGSRDLDAGPHRLSCPLGRPFEHPQMGVMTTGRSADISRSVYWRGAGWNLEPVCKTTASNSAAA